MPCTPFRQTMKDGTVVHGFLCTRGKKPVRTCSICGALSTKLCDGDLVNGRTCDAPLCSQHAAHVEPDKDYCPKHAAAERQGVFL